MTEQTTRATSGQQDLYWTLIENVTDTGTAYAAAKARYEAAKATLERLSLTASETAAALVDAETALQAFAAEHPSVLFKMFRPDHIERALSRDVQTWEL